MRIACLDLESILLPEIWPAVAKATGIDELTRTTKQEPDLSKLMAWRIDILNKNKIKLADVARIAEDLNPLPGAKAFLDWLNNEIPVVVLTDAGIQTIAPMLGKLDNPTAFCNDFKIKKNGSFEEFVFRISDQKTKAIVSFQGMNFETIAVGDSFNDLHMLRESNYSILYSATNAMKNALPNTPQAENYTELKNSLKKSFQNNASQNCYNVPNRRLL